MKKIVLTLSLFSLFSCTAESKRPKGNAAWTFLSYIQADNNLEAFANYNIAAMQSAGSTDDLNLLVQLDEPRHTKTWRYKIVKNGITNDDSLNQEMGVDQEKELIDGVQWATSKYPSKYFMLGMWNHGNGTLDEPKINPKSFKNKKKNVRGILYDYSMGTFLDNQQLDRALAAITSPEILGKKIDIIGMDACLMAMIEVAYQIKEYGTLFVASENLEKVPGWHYAYFLQQLTRDAKNTTPFQLATSIVETFEAFNKQRTQTYTQSAIVLDRVKAVKEALDQVLTCIDACKQQNADAIKYAVKAARERSLEFDKGKYIDLLSFLTQLQIESQKNRRATRNDSVYNQLLLDLQQAIITTQTQLSNAVYANRVGTLYQGAGGLSIYFPRQAIHASYQLTKFAQDSAWLQFIQDYRLVKK